MTQIGEVTGILRLRDEFTGVLTKASTQLQQSGAKMRQVGQQMSAAGGALTRSVTLPLVAMGGAAVNAFGQFDAAMTQSLAIMGDVSETMRKDMADAAREVGKEVNLGATKAAESYFFLASAGLDAATSVEALPKVSKFAKAGMFDMALATDLLTDAQSALGLTIRDTETGVIDVTATMENMARVSDVLVKANTLANATVEQFSTALTREAGAAMKSFNIDIEEGVAVLAAFADQGVKGEIAGTGLSRILRLMSAAAIKNSAAYKELGVSVFDASGQMRNIADIIADLEQAFDGMSDAQRTAALDALGFKARVQGVILPLLGTSDAIRRYEAELRKAGGTTEEVAQKQMQTLFEQLKGLKVRLMDALITLGQAFAPTIQNVVIPALDRLIEKLTAAAEWFADLPQGVQATILALGAIAAAAGPVLLVLGGLVAAIGQVKIALGVMLPLISGPVGIVAAVTATVLAIKPLRELLIDLGGKVLSAVVGWVKQVVASIREWWASTEELRAFLGRLVSVIADDFVGGLRNLGAQWLENVRKVRDAIAAYLEWSGIADAVKTAVHKFAVEVRALWDVIVQVTVAIWEWIGGLEGVLRVLTVIFPGLDRAVAKLEEWVKKAGADAVEATDRFAGSASEASASVEGMDAAMAELRAELPPLIQTATDLGGAFEEMGDSGEDAGKKVEQGFDALEAMSVRLVNGFPLMTRGMREAADATDELAEGFDALEAMSVQLVGGFPVMTRGFRQVAEEATSSWDQMADGFAEAIAKMILEAESFEDALMDLFRGRARAAFTSFINDLLDGFSQGMEAGGGFISSLVGSFREAFKQMGSTATVFSAGFSAQAGDWSDIGISAMSAVSAYMQGNWAGAAIAGIGAVTGALRKLFGESTDHVLEELKRFGLEISEELKAAIDRTFAEIGDAGAALRQHLAEIIRETGVETEAELRNFVSLVELTMVDLERALISGEMAIESASEAVVELLEQFTAAGGGIDEFNRLINVAIDTIAKMESGLLDTAETTEFLETSFAAFLEVAQDLGDEGLEAIRRLVAAARNAGLEIEAINAALRDAVSEAMDVLAERSRFIMSQMGELLGGIQSMISEFGAATVREVRFAESAVLSAFAAMIEAGASLVDVMEQLGPAWESITERAEELGLDLGPEFERLGEIMDILAEQHIQNVIGRLEGMGAAVQALGNVGLLTADQLDAFGDRTRRAFRALIRQGLTAEEALAVLAPQLQILNDMAQQYGITLDRNTQKLIEQAMAQGLVVDAGLTTEDILIRGFDRMLEALNALIEALGGVPIQFANWADAAEVTAETTTQAAQRAAQSATEAGEEAASSWEQSAEETSEAVTQAAQQVEDEMDRAAADSAVAAAQAGNAWVDAAHQAESAVHGMVERMRHNLSRGIPINFDVRVRGGGDPLQYQHGSGEFMDFGAGTLAVLHGREQVITASQGESIGQMVASAMRTGMGATEEGWRAMVEGQRAILRELRAQTPLERRQAESFTDLARTARKPSPWAADAVGTLGARRPRVHA